MGVALHYPSTGEPTLSLSLPNAAHNQPVTIGINQALGRTASGVVFVQPHGGTFYRITRTFESLSESEIKSVVDFLAEIRYAGREIRYSYVDARSGATRNAFCRIVYPTKETKIARGVRDIAIVFEQFIHPDHDSDGSSATEGSQGGGVIGDGEDDSPSITSGLIAFGKVGESFEYTISAVGAATITFDASGMPAWMSRTGAVLSGTPTPGDHGIHPVTITATNDDGEDEEILNLHIEIEDAEPSLAAYAPVVYDDGIFFVNDGETISLSLLVAGDRPLTWGTPTGSLPPGLSWNATTMVISGTITPTTNGVYTWSAGVTNDEGSDTATVVLNVEVAPAVTAGDGSFETWEGEVESWPITVTAHEGAEQTITGTLPDGLTYDEATRTVSGTVASGAEGDYLFEVEFENEFGTDTATFNVAVVPLVPDITSDLYSVVNEGDPISIAMTAIGKPTITWSLSGAPGWLSIDSGTGEITGTAPSVAIDSDIYSFDVIATNGEGNDTQNYDLEVMDVP